MREGGEWVPRRAGQRLRSEEESTALMERSGAWGAERQGPGQRGAARRASMAVRRTGKPPRAPPARAPPRAACAPPPPPRRPQARRARAARAAPRPTPQTPPGAPPQDPPPATTPPRARQRLTVPPRGSTAGPPPESPAGRQGDARGTGGGGGSRLDAHEDGEGGLRRLAHLHLVPRRARLKSPGALRCRMQVRSAPRRPVGALAHARAGACLWVAEQGEHERAHALHVRGAERQSELVPEEDDLQERQHLRPKSTAEARARGSGFGRSCRGGGAAPGESGGRGRTVARTCHEDDSATSCTAAST